MSDVVTYQLKDSIATIPLEDGNVHALSLQLFSELDAAAAWQDTEPDTFFDVWMWVKNTGAKTIKNLDDLDVFVHTGGTSARIPHEDDAGGSFPRWATTVEGGGDWREDATLKITVHYSGALAAGDYTLEVVTPAGARTIERFTF